jgi:acyl carrier protein
MIPNEFVELDRIPLTPQGKLDRAALAEARQRQPARDGQLAPPRTETERRVADEILKPVLELDEIGADDNFFELGGHSLQVLNVLSRVRSIFGVEIRVTQFFQVPTLAGIAAVIDGTAGADEDRPDRELLLQAIEKVEGSLEPDGAEASC